MKSIYALLICLSCTFSFAQKSPQELAGQVFKFSADNNIEAYKKLFPNIEALKFYIHNVDPKADLSEEFFKTAYLKGLNDAVDGLSEFRETASEMHIDLKKAVITKVDTKPNEVDMTDSGKVKGIAKTTIINVHFKAAEKNYILTILNAVDIKGIWYLSGEPFDITVER